MEKRFVSIIYFWTAAKNLRFICNLTSPEPCKQSLSFPYSLLFDQTLPNSCTAQGNNTVLWAAYCGHKIK
jgi:hypothetical protein